MTAPGKGLLRDIRGAIYTELLIIVPLVALTWIFARHVHRLGRSQLDVERQARQCAWAYAAGGCRGGGATTCQLDGPHRLDAPELVRVTVGGLEDAVRPIPGLAAQLQRTPGDEIVARASDTVTAPPLLGGRAGTEHGMDRMLCNERARGPQLRQVWDLTCKGLLGPGERCP